MTLTLVDKVKRQLSAHLFKISNFVIFQSVWMLCVIGQDRYTLLALALIALHFACSPSRLADAKLVLFVASIGIGLDYLLMMSAVFEFSQGTFPLWLAILWPAFALTLNHSMAWLAERSLALQIGLGGIGGASSYLGGYFLSAVHFNYSLALTAFILFLVWALATPLYCSIQGLIKRHAQAAA